MQKLFVQTHLPASVDACWDLFESEAFRDALQAKNGMVSEVLETHTEGSVEVTRLRYTAADELPAVAAKAFGSKHLSYEQVNRLDRDASTLTWTVELPGVGDKVSVSGTTTMTPSGDGCTRTVDGTIEVKIRFIGGQIEKAVVGRFETSMREVGELARSMLSERA